MKKIEVYKTNISHKEKASKVKKALLLQNTSLKISFDLRDCDRILRIEGEIEPMQVVQTGKEMHIVIDVLLD